MKDYNRLLRGILSLNQRPIEPVVTPAPAPADSPDPLPLPRRSALNTTESTHQQYEIIHTVPPNMPRKKIAIFFPGRIRGYQFCMDHILKLREAHDIVFFCALNIAGITNYEYKFFEMCDMAEDQYVFSTVTAEHWIYSLDNRGRVCNRQNVYSHFYNNKRCFDLIEKYEIKHNIQFDYVMKCRADIVASSPIPIVDVAPNTIYIPNTNIHASMNDQIGYGTKSAMKIYCDLINNILYYCRNMKVHYHPETLVLHQILHNGLDIKKFVYSYSLHPSRN